MKKRILAAALAAVCLLTGCAGKTSSDSSAGDSSNSSVAESNADTAEAGDSTVDTSKVKAGFVYIGKITDGGYTQAHDQGRLAIEALGVETAYVEDVPETVSDCNDAIRTLIDEGCNLI